MTLEKWENDFKGFIKELSMPRDDYNGIMEYIDEVPNETNWIPVSERLPEKQDCYLVTTKWKGSCSGDVYIETDMAVYREKQKEWDRVEVIAWMPLPQPYKAERENQ